MTEPKSVSTEPYALHAEASQSVLDFSTTVIDNIFKQTLNLLIEHLEEEELKVKDQKFHQINLNHSSSSMRQHFDSQV